MKNILIILIISMLITSTTSAENRRHYKVTAKAYTAHKAQTDNNPNETAYGKKPKKGVTIAVSKDLKHLKNKRVKLIDKNNKSLGIFVVQDRMARKHRRSIDIFFGKNKKLAKEFGVKKNIKLIVL